jgi:hypothetical protein
MDFAFHLSAWCSGSARLLDTQEVVGSNPTVDTLIYKFASQALGLMQSF